MAKREKPAVGTTVLDQVRDKQEAAKLEQKLSGLLITVTVENLGHDGREDPPDTTVPPPDSSKVPVRDDAAKIDLSPTFLLDAGKGGHPKLTFSITIAR